MGEKPDYPLVLFSPSVQTLQVLSHKQVIRLTDVNVPLTDPLCRRLELRYSKHPVPIIKRGLKGILNRFIVAVYTDSEKRQREPVKCKKDSVPEGATSSVRTVERCTSIKKDENLITMGDRKRKSESTLYEPSRLASVWYFSKITFRYSRISNFQLVLVSDSFPAPHTDMYTGCFTNWFPLILFYRKVGSARDEDGSSNDKV